MQPGKVIIAVLVLLLGYVGYKAVTSIPEIYVADAQSFAASIERQKRRLERLLHEFEETMASDNGPFLNQYSEKESWPQSFVAAKKSLAEAQKLNITTVEGILERDHKEALPLLIETLKAGSLKVKSSVKDSQYPGQRAKFMLDGRDNKDAYFSHSDQMITEAVTQVTVFTNKAKVSTEKHPAKNEDIRNKVADAETILGQLKTAFVVLQKEYGSDTTDYAVYGASYNEIKELHKSALDYVKLKSELLAQLDRSYVKVLADQKVDYFIVVGRANWCEGDSCYDGSELRYPAAHVDENTFEYFDGLNISTIATMSSGWGSRKFNLSIPQNRWNALGVSPTYRWNNREPQAEYWVDNSIMNTHHKYSIIEDGKVTAVDWVSVNNDLFWKHQEHLGMAIESKPLGYYESELISTAEPVGMATIAPPTVVNGVASGSNQYGEWRQSGGISFWHYYGMYRIFGDFVTPGRYSYNDWNGYRTHGRRGAYYGQKDEYGTYGSSTYSHSKYKDSDFSKRNPSAVSEARTKRTSIAGGSVRGAGPAGRGKGPSGSGK